MNLLCILLAPEGVPNMFSPTHAPRTPLRTPAPPMTPLGHPPQRPQMLGPHGPPQMAPAPQLPAGPQMTPGPTQLASPRLAAAPAQMSPATPQIPGLNRPMSLPSPQHQLAMAQQRAVAPKLEPPDSMDARQMWLPKRMNHCKLLDFDLHFMISFHILFPIWIVVTVISFSKISRSSHTGQLINLVCLGTNVV